MKSNVFVFIIAFIGLLVGQSVAHTCNAAAIANHDEEQSSYPPACTNLSEACNHTIVRAVGQRVDGEDYPTMISTWTNVCVVESISGVHQAWSDCHEAAFFFALDVSIGGSFTLTVDWHNAGVTYTTPVAETISLYGQVTMNETNHSYRWTVWTKNAEATFSGTTATYAWGWLGPAQTGYYADTDSSTVAIASGVYYKAQCCQ